MVNAQDNPSWDYDRLPSPDNFVPENKDNDDGDKKCESICLQCCLSRGISNENEPSALMFQKFRMTTTCMVFVCILFLHRHMITNPDVLVFGIDHHDAPQMDENHRILFGQTALFVRDFDEFERALNYTHALAPKCKTDQDKVGPAIGAHPSLQELQHRINHSGIWTSGVAIQFWRPLEFSGIWSFFIGLFPLAHLPLVGGGLSMIGFTYVLWNEVQCMDKTEILLLDNHNKTILHHPLLSMTKWVQIPLTTTSDRKWAREIHQLCPSTGLHLDERYLSIPLRTHHHFQSQIDAVLQKRWVWLWITFTLSLSPLFIVSPVYYVMWFEYSSRRLADALGS